jgi:ABC-type antimicrobial peptide transport system permease subunit
VIGVIGNVHQNGLENQEPPAQVFIPIAQALDEVSGQNAGTSFSLVVRTKTDPMRLRQQIEDVVFQIDRSQPVSNWQTMEGLLADSLMRRKFVMQLLAAFAIVAITLAIVGIYGVVTYAMTQRRREMGIRLALGATVSSIRWLVVGQGVKLGIAGVILGLIVAAPLSRLISTQLFNTQPTDPLLYGAAAVLLLIVSGFASGLPAIRASRVDPVLTLRQE